jgi:hypothetical protein
MNYFQNGITSQPPRNETASFADVRGWLKACPIVLHESLKCGIEAMVSTADAGSRLEKT